MPFKRSLTGAAGRAAAGLAKRKLEAKKAAWAAEKALKRQEPGMINATLNLMGAAKQARKARKAKLGKCVVCENRRAVNGNGSCDLPLCVNIAAQML